MPETDLLPEYLDHLEARVRMRLHRASGTDEERGRTIPASVAALRVHDPAACLALLIRALDEELAPEAVAAVGDGLLDDLLNESAGRIADQVSDALRTNRTFRQAFGFGKHASVDPAVIEEWVSVLARLGTTKERERKSTWKRRV